MTENISSFCIKTSIANKLQQIYQNPLIKSTTIEWDIQTPPKFKQVIRQINEVYQTV